MWNWFQASSAYILEYSRLIHIDFRISLHCLSLFVCLLTYSLTVISHFKCKYLRFLMKDLLQTCSANIMDDSSVILIKIIMLPYLLVCLFAYWLTFLPVIFYLKLKYISFLMKDLIHSCSTDFLDNSGIFHIEIFFIIYNVFVSESVWIHRDLPFSL